MLPELGGDSFGCATVPRQQLLYAVDGVVAMRCNT